jgi:hypothetical protein
MINEEEYNKKHRINDKGLVEKYCNKCETWKIMTTEFYKHNINKSDGYNTHCKECIKKRQRNRFEAMRQYKKQWDVENKSKVSQYNKE